MLLVPQVQASVIVVPTEKPEIIPEIISNEESNKKSNSITTQKQNKTTSKIENIDDIINKIEKEYKFAGKTTKNTDKQENNNKNYKFVGGSTTKEKSDIKTEEISQQTDNTTKEITKLTSVNKPKDVVIQENNTQKNETKKAKNTQTPPTQTIKVATQKEKNKESQEIDKKLETAMEEQQIDNINTKTIKNIPDNKNIFAKSEQTTKQEDVPNTIKEMIKKEDAKREVKQQQKIEKLERVVQKEEENKIDYKFTENITNTQTQDNIKKQETKQVDEQPQQKIEKTIKKGATPKETITKETVKKEAPIVAVTNKEKIENINKTTEQTIQQPQKKVYKTELNNKEIAKKEVLDITKTINQPTKQYNKYPTKIVKSSNYSIEEPSNNLNLISQIEQNLLYNTSGQQKQQQNGNKVEIKKGGWSKEDLTEVKKDTKLKITTKSSTNIDLNIKQAEQNNKIASLKEKAYEAINLKEYEIAIKLYKEILRLNKNDNFTKLSLATTYHILGQYIQAKPLYMELLPVFPNSEQLISNLLSIIIQESPYEAIYLLPPLAKKYNNSAVIQAQTSVAFSSVERYKDAIQYIYKAIQLDSENVEYKYNLAVLYDITKQYDKAYKTYKNIYEKSKSEGLNVISINKIEERLKKLKRYL